MHTALRVMKQQVSPNTRVFRMLLAEGQGAERERRGEAKATLSDAEKASRQSTYRDGKHWAARRCGCRRWERDVGDRVRRMDERMGDASGVEQSRPVGKHGLQARSGEKEKADGEDEVRG